MRSLLLSLILGISLTGCAGLQPPKSVFGAMEPLVISEREEIPPIPRVERPVTLTEVPCARMTPCFTGPIQASDGGHVYAYTIEDANTLRTALIMGEAAQEAAVKYQDSMLEREAQIRALQRLGRLTEAQADILVSQVHYYERQYRWEWMQARLAMALALWGLR